MSKWIVGTTLALVLAMVSFGAGIAAESIELSGAWWNNQVSSESQIWVAAALTDAYAAGWGAGSTAEGARVESESQLFLSEANAERLHGVIYRKNQDGTYAAFNKEPTFSRTFGFYAAGITDFYATHPNSQASVGFAIGCLADKPAETCDQIDGLSQ